MEPHTTRDMRIEPLVLYHPSRSGTGGAFQLECRVPVEYDNEQRVQHESVKKGGVFAVWAQQEANSGTGADARFLWNESWSIKLGLTDMVSWLSSRERVRLRGLDVVNAKKPGVWERLHRSGKAPAIKTSVIRYSFDLENQDGGVFGVSISKDERRMFKFSDDEELLMSIYLGQCVEQFCWLGKR